MDKFQLEDPVIDERLDPITKSNTPPSSAKSISFSEIEDERHNERIRVFVRVRPSISHETTVSMNEMVSTTSKTLRVPTSQTQMECSFDQIFSVNATQEEIYSTVQPLVADVLDGYNATIFAYGQTGTGKTHTILGMDQTQMSARTSTPDPTLSDPSWGIIPRALCQLVTTVALSNQCSITCAYLQIYNEKIYDLLTDKKRQRPLPLREALDGTSDMTVQGLSNYPIASQADVLAFLKRGHLHRVVRETDMNAQSSRSHAILQVTLKTQSKEGCRRAKLNLVDLAGSEKWNKQAMKPGVEIEEMKNINTSLSALGNCIAALTQPGRKHIPYRDSSLTRLLQDSLGGNTRTVLIATITSRASDETVRTIQFADRTRSVMQCVVLNQNVPLSPRQLHLGLTAARAHIAKLKNKLHDLVEHRDKHVDVAERVQKYERQIQEKEETIENLLAQNESYERKLREGQQQIAKLQQQIQQLESNTTKVNRQVHNNQLDPINYQMPLQRMPSQVISPAPANDDKVKSRVLFKAMYGQNNEKAVVTPSIAAPIKQNNPLPPADGSICVDHKLKGCVLCALRSKLSSSSTYSPPNQTSYVSKPRPSPRTIVPALGKAKGLPQENVFCAIHHLNRCILCNKKSTEPITLVKSTDGNCTPHGLTNCVLCARQQPLRAPSFVYPSGLSAFQANGR